MIEVETSTLLRALAALQAELPSLSKDKTATVRSDKGSYQYAYSSLDSIVETVGPLLVKHRLAWMTKPGRDELGPYLEYRLGHVDTGEVETRPDAAAARQGRHAGARLRAHLRAPVRARPRC